MKEIVPKDSRYVPFAQQQSCCVPTSILMVMYKKGIPLVSQELLGYHIGLTVSEEYEDLFWSVRTGEKPPAGYGTQIFSEDYSLDKAFDELNIPLRMKFHSVEMFGSLKEMEGFVEKSIEENRDMLALFQHAALKGEDRKDGGGHTCVVDRIYSDQGIIRLIDPSTNQPKWRMAETKLLKDAMEKHPTKNGGFIELISV